MIRNDECPQCEGKKEVLGIYGMVGCSFCGGVGTIKVRVRDFEQSIDNGTIGEDANEDMINHVEEAEFTMHLLNKEQTQEQLDMIRSYADPNSDEFDDIDLDGLDNHLAGTQDVPESTHCVVCLREKCTCLVKTKQGYEGLCACGTLVEVQYAHQTPECIDCWAVRQPEEREHLDCVTDH